MFGGVGPDGMVYSTVKTGAFAVSSRELMRRAVPAVVSLSEIKIQPKFDAGFPTQA